MFLDVQCGTSMNISQWSFPFPIFSPWIQQFPICFVPLFVYIFQRSTWINFIINFLDLQKAPGKINTNSSLNKGLYSVYMILYGGKINIKNIRLNKPRTSFPTFLDLTHWGGLQGLMIEVISLLAPKFTHMFTTWWTKKKQKKCQAILACLANNIVAQQLWSSYETSLFCWEIWGAPPRTTSMLRFFPTRWAW